MGTKVLFSTYKGGIPLRLDSFIWVGLKVYPRENLVDRIIGHRCNRQGDLLCRVRRYCCPSMHDTYERVEDLHRSQGTGYLDESGSSTPESILPTLA